jgi:RNA polymerase sigma factor (sigma-70 family)
VAFRIAAGELKHRSRFVVENDRRSYELPVDAIAVSSLLSRLPPKQRAAVILHYFADLPDSEVARVLGITKATVRVHLSQGRKRLRQFFEEDDD